METYKVEPGKKISLHIKDGFYAAQAMVTIRAMGLPENLQKSHFRFDVNFFNVNGNNAGFPILLTAPYFFDAGTSNLSPGPFYFVEIISSEDNPSLVIQIGFTNRLA